jgi:hypothetical protein
MERAVILATFFGLTGCGQPRARIVAEDSCRERLELSSERFMTFAVKNGSAEQRPIRSQLIALELVDVPATITRSQLRTGEVSIRMRVASLSDAPVWLLMEQRGTIGMSARLSDAMGRRVASPWVVKADLAFDCRDFSVLDARETRDVSVSIGGGDAEVEGDSLRVKLMYSMPRELIVEPPRNVVPVFESVESDEVRIRVE